jgi:DNA invertase Pin-like site-specific DNA recombinase
MPTAVIYARRSKSDDPDELSRSVEEQIEACREFCRRKKWKVAAEPFIDDGRSASRYAKKVRPQFRQLVERITAGEVDAVVAWDLDRLLRNPVELETLIDLSDRGDLRVVALGGSDIKLESSDGRFIARILVAKAAKESDDISRRTRRAKEAKAGRGEPVRMDKIDAFGWVDGMTPNPTEAAVIKESARRLLGGEIGVTGLAREWNAAGHRTPRRARQWTSTTVRAVLSSPRNAGLAVHRGEVIGQAQWPAILDRSTHEALVALFADPARKTKPRRITTWTRLIRCGRCGQVMVIDSTNSGRRVYRCKGGPPRCGRMAVTADHVEPLVLEAVFRVVDHGMVPTDEPVTTRVATDADALAAVERELLENTDDLDEGRVTRAQYLRRNKRLMKRHAALSAAVVADQRPTAADAYLGREGALRAVWDDLDVERRNAVLHAVIDRVVVKPTTAGGRFFDPERVDVVWRA